MTCVRADQADWPAAAALVDRDALAALDARFVRRLSHTDPALAQRLLRARAAPPDGLAESTLLIDLAAALEAFIADEFGIPDALARLQARHHATEPLLRVKYKFVKRQGLLGVPPETREALDAVALRARLVAQQADPDDEPGFADQVLAWQAALRRPDTADKDTIRAALDCARDYAAWAAGTPAGRLRHRHGVLFDHPQPQDAAHRLEFVDKVAAPGGGALHRIDARALHPRTGFVLSDPGFALPGAMDQAKYCLLCHHQGNDSCSHGLPAAAETGQADTDEPRFARSAGGEPLAGCPLEQRISEFHELKLAGHPIGALAMIVLDNPMVAATGHRICNDCLKACVYQQQTPVDIPQAETRVLRDVLELPWGVEIYALLTRWNPLDLRRWLPAPPSGRRVLVVGAGPAGFTLAHHLLNAGHEVVAIDGLRIEPDVDDGAPVRELATLQAPLDQRIAAGFGGVAEYGITVRWDKNFLRLVRRLLERRRGFRLFGGVRFGSAVDPSQAWALGFDHVALATGAGRPTMLTIPGGLANGVRAASDFLMALQLTGAARADSLANLQLRLPAVVIGAGLTAMDTATEASPTLCRSRNTCIATRC
ncbi:MAG: FAD-dependent oxidoreductase [Burkholderiaceae bacterium]